MAKGTTKYALDIIIGGKVDPKLKKAVEAAAKHLKGLDSSKIGKAAKVAAGLGIGLKVAGKVGSAAFRGIKATASAAVDVTKKAVENAAAYEKQMANVSTLLSGTQQEVTARTTELKQELLKTSNVTGVATENLTDGLYQVISAYGDTADAARITELAAKSGAAGMATTTDAVNLMSAVTKAYGDTSYEANRKVSDMAFETVKLGQTTYPELASSIQQVTSLSKAMNVSQEEMFGVFAAGTGVIGDAAGVATKLKATYTKLQKPTKELQGAMESLGYKSGDAMIQSLGLQGTLDALSTYADKAGISLAKMYGSSEAAILATALTGDLSDAWTEKTAAMSTDAKGQTDAAFAKQSGTADYSWQMLKNIGQNALTQIGEQLLPYLTQISQDALPVLMTAVEGLTPALDSIFSAIDWDSMSALIAQLLPIAVQTIESLLPVLQELLPPIAEIGVSILGLLPLAGELLQQLLPAIVPLMGPILSIVQSLAPLIEALLPIITLLITQTIGDIQNFLSFIATILDVISPILTALCTFISGVFAGNWTQAWEGIKGVVLGVVNAIIAALNWVIDKINSISFDLPNLKILGSYAGKHIGFNIPKVPDVKMAEGGIVTRATTALIGEGSEPEAVLPLSKLWAFLDKASVALSGTGVTYYFTFSPVIYAASAADVEEVMEDEYGKFRRMMDQWVRDNDRRRF